jgi:hypothetical protein
MLLAPAGARTGFINAQIDPERHAHFLTQLQILRGLVYVQGAFLAAQDLRNGRHQVAADRRSWHLLSLDQHDRLCGCIRFTQHGNEVSYSELAVSHSAIARCPEWSDTLQSGVEEELALARRGDLSVVEVGGWALAEDARGTSEAIRMALATFALSQLVGGAIGITTARERGSATILRKIGGRALKALPPYIEPMYRCRIEILRFYSWDPNPRFKHWIEDLKDELQGVTVLTSGPQPTPWLVPREEPAFVPPPALSTWAGEGVLVRNGRLS